MYLARLKKYGPKLNCVVTLTEELALAQATEAEREIKAGKYRGPLHGIPWGAKDLFATKGIKNHLGRRTLSRSSDRLRRDGRRAVARCGRGAGGETVDGCAGAGRALVCRYDQESMAGRGREDWLQRFFSRPGRCNRRGAGGFFNRH